ncbi:MAG: amino acid adenylation domain-containing protein, partial [Acidobacteriota bacterium]
YTPLADIQKWSDVAVGQPLFESIFVFENAPPGMLQPGSETGAVHIGESRHLFKTNYPLAVQVSPGESLAVRIEYDSRRFGTDTVVRMLSHLETLLEGFVTSPEKSISALSLLSAAEARQLLVEWNDTEAAYPQTATIHELFAAQARRTPNAVGLVFADEQLTFDELNARANRLAHYLRRRGVEPETRVGICMERCVEMVVGLLAILKAGGVCVPLDPSYPRERLAFMLRDTRAPLVLAQARLAGRLPDQGTVLINPDACAEMLAQESADDPASPTQADNLAYIIYTSGSTGMPKGVEICHRGIVRLLFGQQYARLDNTQTTLHLSPSSFDGSFFEVWGALLHGGRCVLFPDQELSVRELGRVIEKHGISVLWLTASLFNAVVDEDPSVLAGVRQLLTGGEALSVTHVTRALESLPGTQITNGYGPSENSTFTCCHRIPRPLAASCHSIPIGRPIANTQVYVLDDQFNPVPIGVTGELYAAGDGLARGYSGQPELTAERFLPNPFSDKPGARMYRTGDLVCYLPDGKLEFLGRRDQQIKLRGFRIELGEIEAALRQHPQVRQAAAVVRTSGMDASRQLLAYVVTDGNGAPSAVELRSFLKERVPEYLIPAAFIAVESLPLTPNGKLDRRALADRELASTAADAPQTAPSTPVEELLASLCAAVLKVERVGVNDDFFALGGHSLLAMQLISRIRDAFKVELPVRSLFEAPTVTSMAVEIEKMLGAEQSILPVAPTQASREGDVPLSFAQQRLWILDQFDPGLPAYNIPLAVLVQGRLHVAALADSLNEVVRRHEALRTSFATRDGQPRQVIAPALNIPLPVIDLGGLPQAEREVEARRLITNEAMRRFDLSRGPLLNALLLKLDAEEHIIVLTLHHIVADGWSLEVLLDEVATLYEGFQNETAPALPELPIQYADYAVWERERLQGEALERQFAYWRARLAGAPAGLELLTDRSRPA